MCSTRSPIPGCAMTDIGFEAIVTSAGLAPPRRGRSIRRLFRHRSFVIGFVIIVVLALAAIFAPLLTSLDPSAMKVRFRFRSPASEFYLWYRHVRAGHFYARALWRPRLVVRWARRLRYFRLLWRRHRGRCRAIPQARCAHHEVDGRVDVVPGHSSGAEH